MTKAGGLNHTSQSLKAVDWRASIQFKVVSQSRGKSGLFTFWFLHFQTQRKGARVKCTGIFFFFVTTCVASLNVPLTKIIYLHAYILSDCLVMGSASYGVFWSHMACGTNSNVTQWTECAVSFLYKYHKFPEILDLVVAVNLEILMGFTQCRQLKCDKNKDQRFSGHNQIISDHIK